MWSYLATLFLGWSLGANNAADLFGTAVTSKMVRFRTAAILSGIFVVIGALYEGNKGLDTIKDLATQTTLQAVVIVLATAFAVTLMTKFKMPVSVSQAIIGAIVGVGLVTSGVNWQGLRKIVICWVGTPTGAALISFIFYHLLSKIFQKLNPNFVQFDRAVRAGLVISGVYSAYAFGANNVANVTGVFYGAGLFSSAFEACLFGSLSIAFGIITYGRMVMDTIGDKIVPLTPFGALVAAMASAFTVHLYAKVGVPVSSSQAIVGAVIGIAFVEGLNLLNLKTVSHVFLVWLISPAIAAGAAVLFLYLSKMRIVFIN